MEQMEPAFTLRLFNLNIDIAEGVVIQWVIIAVIGVICYMLTRNLNEKPNKKQSTLEMFVEMINNLVRGNMGEEYMAFVPYIGSLLLYLAVVNNTGLLGFPSPASDYSVTLGMALITFIVIQAYTIKKLGIIHYFGGFAKPLPLLLPINIMERVMLPVSLSLRLFGNVTAGVVIIDLLYKALENTARGVFQLALPIPLHLYFDIFDGLVQAVIFVMLTMINIKIISEH